MLSPGQTFGGWVVEDIIASGGVSTVYRVHSPKGELCAMKVFHHLGESVVPRLQRAFRIQSRLAHPNLVTARELVEEGGDWALLMDYVEGDRLDDWVSARKPDLELATRIFRDILEGVGRAHELDIIHRDLKPANILVSDDDGRWRARITDFGLVKLLDASEADEEITLDDVAMGTLEYTAPEQFLDAARVDHRADLFALGCVYYQLLTGVPPFRRPGQGEVMKAIRTGEFKDPRQYVELPRGVVELVRSMLEPDPDLRPRSVRAILARLDDPVTSTFDPNASKDTEPRAPVRTASPALQRVETDASVEAALPTSFWVVLTIPVLGALLFVLLLLAL